MAELVHGRGPQTEAVIDVTDSTTISADAGTCIFIQNLSDQESEMPGLPTPKSPAKTRGKGKGKAKAKENKKRNSKEWTLSIIILIIP